jgi:glycosidase
MVSFLNNHDTNRALTQLGDDINKYKMAIGWLLTTRGIPQLYYGEEILMKGKYFCIFAQG